MSTKIFDIINSARNSINKMQASINYNNDRNRLGQGLDLNILTNKLLSVIFIILMVLAGYATYYSTQATGEAIRFHKNLLGHSSNTLDEIANLTEEFVEQHPKTSIIIEAETYWIHITGPIEWMRDLVRQELMVITDPEEQERLRQLDDHFT